MFAARVDPRTKAKVGERLTLTVDPSRLYFFSPETGESLVARARPPRPRSFARRDPPPRVHARAPRADLAAPPRCDSPVGDRAVDELRVAGPVDRIALRRGAAARLPAGRARRAARAALGDLLVPACARRSRRSGTAGASTSSGRRRAESTLWIDGRAVQGLHGAEPHQRPDATLLARARGGQRSSSQIEVACNGLFGRLDAPPELDAVRARRSSTRTPGSRYFDFEVLRALEASGTARARLGRPPARGAQPLLQRARPCDPRGALRAPQRHARARDRARSAMRTSTRRGSGRSQRRCRKLVRTFSSQTRYMDEYPEYRLRVLAGAAVRVGRGAGPGSVGAHPREGRGGQFVPVGGTLGRARLQHPVGRVARAPVRARPALLRGRASASAAASSGRRTRSATAGSCRRSCGSPASTASSRRSSRGTASTSPTRTRSSGRATTAARCSATSRPPTTTTATSSVDELLRTARDFKDHESSAREPARLRLRRRRRRADARDARDACAARATCRGCRASRPATSDEFFAALEAEDARAARRRRRAVLRVPPRRLHVAGVREARQPRLRAAAARRRVPRGGARRATRAPSSTGSGSSCCCSSSTTSSPARRSGSSTTTHAATSPSSSRALDALVGDGRDAGEHDRRSRGARSSTAADVSRRRRTRDGRVVEADDEVRVDGLTLENAHLRVDASARTAACSSVVDKATGRETLAAPGNRLELYEDGPVKFDAWDIDPSTSRRARDCPPADSWSVVSNGPLRAEIAFERRVGER